MLSSSSKYLNIYRRVLYRSDVMHNAVSISNATSSTLKPKTED